MISHAQNFEDVMLERLFAGQERGFYVDIGAAHPLRLSVTRHFYERGWRGINVEPIANNWELFRKHRPLDTNLNVAVSSRPGRAMFCEVLDDYALSTLVPGRMEEIERAGGHVLRYEVACVTGDSILEQAPGEIDFLSIDVEGAEEDVLRSIDFRRHRPKVLLVEAVAPVEHFPGWDAFSPEAHARWHEWEPQLLASGYRFAHFDGLNRFYLREDLAGLAPRLAIPPGVFDFILADMAEDEKRRRAAQAHVTTSLLEKEQLIQQLHQAAGDLQAQLADMRHQLDLRDADARQRLADARNQVEQREAELAVLRVRAEHAEREVQSLQQHAAGLDAMNQLAGSREAHFALVRSLEEKESVIQELRRALDAYRAAFSIFGHLVRPLQFGLSPLRLVAQRGRRMLLPRLGNLVQHPPRTLQLPRNYGRVPALAAPPRISIVTPSYNQAAFIERTVQSVLDQSYPNLEYFVQDGASNDGTVEILQRYASRLTGWESEKDSGQTQAINRGFARTSGEIMAWLNSDDVLFPGALAYIADFFNRHPDVDVVYGHRILIDESDRQIGRWILPRHDDDVLSWADYVPQETLFWRRRIWDKAGGRLDESFKFAMDWDLLVRFRDAGARFERLPRLLGGFRVHARQKTSAVISDVGFKEMDRIRERALGRVPTHAEVTKAVLPYLMKHVGADFRWRLRQMLGGAA